VITSAAGPSKRRAAIENRRSSSLHVQRVLNRNGGDATYIVTFLPDDGTHYKPRFVKGDEALKMLLAGLGVGAAKLADFLREIHFVDRLVVPDVRLEKSRAQTASPEEFFERRER
jgi:hypothetical protein